MASPSSTLAWKIPWTEETGRLQSMGSLRVGHDWATSLSVFTFHFHALEKEMATHSSVLARRIPGTGEPGELPSMGSHRVGHDCSDFAAAAAAEKCQGQLAQAHLSCTWNSSSHTCWSQDSFYTLKNSWGPRSVFLFCICVTSINNKLSITIEKLKNLVTHLKITMVGPLHFFTNVIVVRDTQKFCCCLVAKSCLTLLRPHRLLLTRLLCPWDPPGKNTGVGCHFFLQGIFPIQGWNPRLPHCRWIFTAEPPGRVV